MGPQVEHVPVLTIEGHKLSWHNSLLFPLQWKITVPDFTVRVKSDEDSMLVLFFTFW